MKVNKNKDNYLGQLPALHPFCYAKWPKVVLCQWMHF